MAGRAGSGMNIYHIQNSSISISNTTFFNNTGSFSFLEKQFALPFYEILCMRSNRLNYFTLFKDNPNCKDEISALGSHCFQDEPYKGKKIPVNHKNEPFNAHPHADNSPDAILKQ